MQLAKPNKYETICTHATFWQGREQVYAIRKWKKLSRQVINCGKRAAFKKYTTERFFFESFFSFQIFKQIRICLIATHSIFILFILQNYSERKFISRADIFLWIRMIWCIFDKKKLIRVKTIHISFNFSFEKTNLISRFFLKKRLHKLVFMPLI